MLTIETTMCRRRRSHQWQLLWRRPSRQSPATSGGGAKKAGVAGLIMPWEVEIGKDLRIGCRTYWKRQMVTSTSESLAMISPRIWWALAYNMTRPATILELRSLQMLTNLISSDLKIIFNLNQAVNSLSLLQIKYSFSKAAEIAQNSYKLQENCQIQQ